MDRVNVCYENASNVHYKEGGIKLVKIVGSSHFDFLKFQIVNTSDFV